MGENSESEFCHEKDDRSLMILSNVIFNESLKLTMSLGYETYYGEFWEIFVVEEIFVMLIKKLCCGWHRSTVEITSLVTFEPSDYFFIYIFVGKINAFKYGGPLG